MVTKNLIIEIICDENGKRYFIVREILPNQAPVTVHICDSGDDLASFLDEVKME